MHFKKYIFFLNMFYWSTLIETYLNLVFFEFKIKVDLFFMHRILLEFKLYLKEEIIVVHFNFVTKLDNIFYIKTLN